MRYCGLLFLLPYIMGFSSSDTSYTETEIGAGAGQYTYSDCSGAHTQKFMDAGVRATHKFEAPFRVGISAGTIPSGERIAFFLYPDLAFDSRFFSLGTTGLRIGSLRSSFFEAKGFDEVPFTTGRGFARIGMGIPITEGGSHLWLGANSGVYQNWGAAAGIECTLDDGKFLLVNGRYGTHNNIPEFGLSLGLRLGH